MVIVFRIPETKMRRRIRIVELANRPDGGELRQVERAGPESILPFHARLEFADEIPLVDHVRAAFESTDALADFDDGRNRGDCSQHRRGSVSVLTREFECQVAAEGVPGDDDAAKATGPSQFVDDVPRVLG